MNRSDIPEVPGHLSEASAGWWRAVLEEYDLAEHQVRLLTLAAESWDRTVEAREILERDGLVYADRFGAPRKHPAVSIEENARIAFARLCRELALADDDTTLEGPRSPRIGGR